jgi:hypothetical protein
MRRIRKGQLAALRLQRADYGFFQYAGQYRGTNTISFGDGIRKQACKQGSSLNRWVWGILPQILKRPTPFNRQTSGKEPVLVYTQFDEIPINAGMLKFQPEKFRNRGLIRPCPKIHADLSRCSITFLCVAVLAARNTIIEVGLAPL